MITDNDADEPSEIGECSGISYALQMLDATLLTRSGVLTALYIDKSSKASCE